MSACYVRYSQAMAAELSTESACHVWRHDLGFARIWTSRSTSYWVSRTTSSILLSSLRCNTQQHTTADPDPHQDLFLHSYRFSSPQLKSNLTSSIDLRKENCVHSVFGFKRSFSGTVSPRASSFRPSSEKKTTRINTELRQLKTYESTGYECHSAVCYLTSLVIQLWRT